MSNGEGVNDMHAVLVEVFYLSFYFIFYKSLFSYVNHFQDRFSSKKRMQSLTAIDLCITNIFDH